MITIPKYPIYCISKSRFDNCLTAKFLVEDKVPFYLVVEPQEYKEYASRFPNVLELPFSNLGLGSIPARNFVWEHAKKSGASRHWILDDNIRAINRRYKTKRIICSTGIALATVEDFIHQYTNIAICGLNYSMFCPDYQKMPPYWLNVHVYSCLCIDNSLPFRWRGRYNEDTDLCLQALTTNLCTVLFNAFTIEKLPTMVMKGGNTDELYKGDGRLVMARSLERQWPHTVSVIRRFKRPQHFVHKYWKAFDTKLIPADPPPPPIHREFILKQLQPVTSQRLKSHLGLEYES